MFSRLATTISRPALRATFPRSFVSSRILRNEENFAKATDPKVQLIVDEVLKLNILQTLELVKVLKETFGYDDSAFAVAAPAAAAPVAAVVEEVAAPVSKKTHFTLKLESFDAASKVKVIKEVRTLTGKGLKEAKELVESAPQILGQDIAKEEAEKLIALFKDNGAVVVME